MNDEYLLAYWLRGTAIVRPPLLSLAEALEDVQELVARQSSTPESNFSSS
jgi:hypothetical protein